MPTMSGFGFAHDPSIIIMEQFLKDNKTEDVSSLLYGTPKFALDPIGFFRVSSLFPQFADSCKMSGKAKGKANMEIRRFVRTAVKSLIFCMVALLLITASVYGADSDNQRKRWISRSAGVEVGYGVSFNNDDSEVQMIGIFPHVRWGMWQWPVGADKCFELGFAVEATLVQFVKPQGDVGAGFAPVIRGALHLPWFTPYMQFGAGPFYTSLDVRDISQEFNFTLQAEGGLEFPFNDWIKLDVGYRYFHVSNANTGSHNLGLDMNMGVAGVSFEF